MSDVVGPTIAVTESVERALDAAVLRAIDGAHLARFLAARRWFGAKARAPETARVAEVVPVAWDGDHAAVARVVVSRDGGETSYQLPLVAREAEMSGAHAPRAVLARIECGGVRGVLFDATEDAAFRARLGAALERGASCEGDGARWWAEPVGDERVPLGTVASRVGSAEQSNTSIVWGNAAILKLFRRLEPGAHPDVDITRFLTTVARFDGTPALLGVLHWRDAGGAESVAGMLTRFVPHAEDGWTHALALATAHLRAPAPKRGREEENPPNPFADDAARLGGVTRGMHRALASRPDIPGFETAPVTAADVSEWEASARRTIDSALALLGDRLPAIAGRTLPMARAIAARRDAALARLAELADAARRSPDLGLCSRHHGDYHLGQVLHAPDDRWLIIDFEGEPARPLAERSAPSSPLRDVAGMLRSFAYAAATAASTVGGLGTNAQVEVRAARWERDARTRFLQAYGASADDPLIAMFELEKVFYELEYELNNRMDWVWVPLRGIAKIF
ncbi:MAG TPA: hypothetical protein VF041_06490 [Gemmatimonadaceae bacterium]